MWRGFVIWACYDATWTTSGELCAVMADIYFTVCKYSQLKAEAGLKMYHSSKPQTDYELYYFFPQKIMKLSYYHNILWLCHFS